MDENQHWKFDEEEWKDKFDKAFDKALETWHLSWTDGSMDHQTTATKKWGAARKVHNDSTRHSEFDKEEVNNVEAIWKLGYAVKVFDKSPERALEEERDKEEVNNVKAVCQLGYAVKVCDGSPDRVFTSTGTQPDFSPHLNSHFNGYAKFGKGNDVGGYGEVNTNIWGSYKDGGSGGGPGQGRIRTLTLPRFDRTDSNEWIMRVEKLLYVYSVSESELLEAVEMAFVGYVLQWYQWENKRRPFRCWSNLKMVILRQYSSPTYQNFNGSYGGYGGYVGRSDLARVADMRYGTIQEEESALARLEANLDENELQFMSVLESEFLEGLVASEHLNRVLVKDEGPYIGGDAKAKFVVESEVSLISGSSAMDEFTEYSVEEIHGLENMEQVAELYDKDSMKTGRNASVVCTSTTEGETAIDSSKGKEMVEGGQPEDAGIDESSSANYFPIETFHLKIDKVVDSQVEFVEITELGIEVVKLVEDENVSETQREEVLNQKVGSCDCPHDDKIGNCHTQCIKHTCIVAPRNVTESSKRHNPGELHSSPTKSCHLYDPLPSLPTSSNKVNSLVQSANYSVNASKGKRHCQEESTTTNDFLQETQGNKQLPRYSEDTIDLFGRLGKLSLCPDFNTTWQTDENVLQVSKSRSTQDKRKPLGGLKRLLNQYGDYLMAEQTLYMISKNSSPHGDGTQRLAHYIATVFEARMLGTGTTLYADRCMMGIPFADTLNAYQSYFTIVTFQRMSNIFANKAIFRQTLGATKLHIIEFGISYEFQWPCILQFFSSRPGGSPHLRITGIDFPEPGFLPLKRVEKTGFCLTNYCKRFNIPFEYNCIVKKWDAIQLEDLKIEEGERLMVNCLYRLRQVSDESAVESGPRNVVLKLIKRINPGLLVLGVLNGTYSSTFFKTRFRDALSHFSTLSDMFEATLAHDAKSRMVMEQSIIAKDAINVIACEGTTRVERPEKHNQWTSRIMKADVKFLPIYGLDSSKFQESEGEDACNIVRWLWYALPRRQWRPGEEQDEFQDKVVADEVKIGLIYACGRKENATWERSRDLNSDLQDKVVLGGWSNVMH